MGCDGNVRGEKEKVKGVQGVVCDGLVWVERCGALWARALGREGVCRVGGVEGGGREGGVGVEVVVVEGEDVCVCGRWRVKGAGGTCGSVVEGEWWVQGWQGGDKR